MIQIIRTPATQSQIEDMQQALESYIKLAVDRERGILSEAAAILTRYGYSPGDLDFTAFLDEQR